jgi:16S rRNA (cytidine1402-2'-O)-methyltransferase
LLRAACATLAPRTRLCIAADLTLDTETVDCRSVARWRGDDARRFDRRPAIFLLQA